MKQIFEIVETYLTNQKSNNALFISGEWGSGKTYFVKETLKPKIADLGFDFLYISVNGLNSIDQLKRHILSEKLTEKLKKNDSEGGNQAIEWVKTQVRRVSSKFLKTTEGSTIGSAIDKMDGSGKASIAYSVFMSMIEPLAFFDFSKVVLCFDDIERISKDLSVEELFGFINSEFVEHKGYKVILVGDETKNQLSSLEYLTNKEKLVGWTIDFKPVIHDSFSSIIKKFDKEAGFYSFLIENHDFLISIIEKIECANLRTIIFFLDCLLKVCKVKNDANELRINKEIAYFCLIICCETKKGKLPKTAPYYVRDRSVLGHKDANEEEQAYAKQFYRFKNSSLLSRHKLTFFYFESIYDFIQTGYLDSESLILEMKTVKEFYTSHRNYEDENFLNNIGGFPYRSNEDFNEYVSVTLNRIDKGDFVFPYFLRACEVLYLAEANDLLDISKTELTDRLIRGLYMVNPKTVPAKDDYYVERHLYSLKACEQILFEKANAYFEEHFENNSKEDLKQNFEKKIENNLKLEPILRLFSVEEAALKLIELVQNRDAAASLVSVFKNDVAFLTKAELIEKGILLRDRLKELIVELNIKYVDRYIIREFIEHLSKLEKTKITEGLPTAPPQ